jgi:uroporphyrinogen decarboxylase
MHTEHLLLKALRGEHVDRPPVWMMRQAGRYLPDYMVLKEKYDFFTRVQTPELVCEITLQPVDQVGVDAAIIFSDILVIPHAMGLEVLMEEKRGPLLPQTVRTQQDIDNLNVTDIAGHLSYVTEAIKLTKKELNNRVPLFGFAGAPWTILCYMVEGKGSKSFDVAKQFCYTQPVLAHALLQKITDATIQYVKAQVIAGVDVIQIFDSWSGLLSPEDFRNIALPYIRQISLSLQDIVPVIVFPKGSWYALPELMDIGAAGIGLDWCITPEMARSMTGSKITLQGNYDPAKLLAPASQIKKEVTEMIDAFGPQRYIANLGHGILPHVPVDHAKAFVEAVKAYKTK